jgi:DNA-binding response OmpR family regulator
VSALRGSETLLLVEDEPAMLNLVAVMLEDLGYTVLKAGSGAEAMRIAESHAGDIDLLVTDVVMPGMNGCDLADRLRSNRPSLRRLFVSGYSDEAISVQKSVEAGAHFLEKPFTLDDLAARVRTALRENA